jgi:hypothetical protein
MGLFVNIERARSSARRGEIKRIRDIRYGSNPLAASHFSECKKFFHRAAEIVLRGRAFDQKRANRRKVIRITMPKRDVKVRQAQWSDARSRKFRKIPARD